MILKIRASGDEEDRKMYKILGRELIMKHPARRPDRLIVGRTGWWAGGSDRGTMINSSSAR
jgi:hypothetical protein